MQKAKPRSEIDSLVPLDQLRDAIVVKALDADSPVYAVLFEDEVDWLLS